jgi:TetR/AcrR family transcriptional regulator, transcriptional repressor for nem operon
MKVSKAQMAKHRQALVDAARALIQERGFLGAGVADISARAGLTQGAFYGQFNSKNALAEEACRVSHQRNRDAVIAASGVAPVDLAALIDGYLRHEHVGDVAGGCPMAANAGEVRRQEPAIQACFVQGFEELATLVQGALAEEPADTARCRALFLVSAMVGSLTAARMAAGTAPALAEEILTGARDALKELGRP